MPVDALAPVQTLTPAPPTAPAPAAPAVPEPFARQRTARTQNTYPAGAYAGSACAAGPYVLAPRALTRTRTALAVRRPPWVLMYHSVSDTADDPYRITVSPHRLDRQLRWLRNRGLTGVGVATLLRARAAGRAAGLVGLTFDDGYADFLGNAVPLLHRYGCTATVYALPGRLGGDNAWDELGPRKPLLDADGLRAAAAAGMEVGSHGLLHTDLTTADDATLERETRGSRALLAELTGSAPEGFCYPYGTVDARVISAVRAAGYRYACAIDPGPLTAEHALPRVHIDASDTSPRLHLKRLLHPLRRKPLPTTPPVAFPAVPVGTARGEDEAKHTRGDRDAQDSRDAGDTQDAEDAGAGRENHGGDGAEGGGKGVDRGRRPEAQPPAAPESTGHRP